MIDKLSVVIPTRGDSPIECDAIRAYLGTFPFVDDIQIVEGKTPYNRYLMAMGSARHPWIYTQDDDCLTDVWPVFQAMAYTPLFQSSDGLPMPAKIVNAMTPEHASVYSGAETLIGFGAIFHVDVARATFVNGHFWHHDELFLRESDRIFASVNPHYSVFPKITILPNAHRDNRYWRQPEHVRTRQEMEQRILDVAGVVCRP